MSNMSLNDVLAKHGFNKDLNEMLDRSPDALTTPPAATVNRTPPSLSPPAGVQALKPASSDLPLKSHTAEDKQLNKVLSPDQVQSLKAEVTDALGDMNKTKKGERKNKPRERKAPVEKKPKTEAAPNVPRGTYARTAAQVVLASLATPARGPEPKPKERATRKRTSSSKKPASKVAKSMKKPAASKSSKKDEIPATQDSDVEMQELFGDDHGGDLDSEEELSDHLNSPTLELPGRGDEVDANESKDPAEPKSLKAAGADDMRGAYWDFIHQEQKKLKKESPEMSGREWLTCDVRMASVSKFSKSEQSRRRIKTIPSVSKSPKK